MRDELNKLWYIPTLEYCVIIKDYVLYILLSESVESDLTLIFKNNMELYRWI